MVKKSVFVPLLCLTAASAFAQEAPAEMENLITPEVIEAIKDWAKAPIVKLSVEAQNAQRGSLSEAEIEALDNQWREEVKSEDKPLIAATLSSPLSSYLLKRQAESGG